MIPAGSPADIEQTVLGKKREGLLRQLLHQVFFSPTRGIFFSVLPLALFEERKVEKKEKEEKRTTTTSAASVKRSRGNPRHHGGRR